MYMILRIRLVQLSIIIVILLAFWYAPTLGQDTRTLWTPPQVVGDGWWQSITVDRQDTAHIGWYGTRADGDTDPANDMDALMYVSRSRDNVWSVPNDVIVTGQGGWTVRNSLVATNDGMLHGFYRGGPDHWFSNVFIPEAASARSWSPPLSVSSGYYLDMIADDHDVLHLVYDGREADIAGLPFNLESDPCALCYDLYYRRSTDGGNSWTPPFNLSRDKDAGSDRPDIWIGQTSGRIYVDWDVGLDWYNGRGHPLAVGLRYSDNGGTTWSAPIILEGNNPAFRPIQIATTELRNGELLAVWRYASEADPRIYFQLSSDLGQTWSEPEPIPDIYARGVTDSTLDDYELLTDSFGVVHLFMVGQPDLGAGANPSLYHIEYRQGRWGAKQRIFYSPDERPEWPKAAIGPQGDIHLTWFVRGIAENATSFESSTIGLKVYYSYRGPILAEQPTLAFEPTRTPQPTPTLERQLVATVTPLPTVEPVTNPVTSRTRDLYASQVVVGGMLAVVVFCGGIIAIKRFWRR
jgi:hypothetical protein